MLQEELHNPMETESQHVEYKVQLNDKLEREVVAFLNSRLGGDLYIGVKDNGEVVGIDDDADKCQLAVSDRLTITSFGGLVNGLSQEEFFRGRTLPRNRELMRVFRDMQWVEHLGSGMHRILRTYGPEIFTISDHFVEVCFRFEEGEEIEVGPINLPSEITERQRNVINLLLCNEPINEPINERLNLSQAEMAKRLGLSVSTLRREFKVLENNGIIRYVGSKKLGRWELCYDDANSNYPDEKLGKELGKELGKKRVDILKAIADDSKISTKQLAEMFRMSSSAMDRHLKCLKDNGFLKHVGPKNGGYWQVIETKDNSDEIE